MCLLTVVSPMNRDCASSVLRSPSATYADLHGEAEAPETDLRDRTRQIVAIDGAAGTLTVVSDPIRDQG